VFFVTVVYPCIEVHNPHYQAYLTLVAIMENGQNEDGSIDIPKVLHSYLGM